MPGLDIDYKLARQEFMWCGRLQRAFYDTALPENVEYSPVHPLADRLRCSGIVRVAGSVKEFTESRCRRRLTGTMHIKPTVDALEHSPQVDHIALFAPVTAPSNHRWKACGAC